MPLAVIAIGGNSLVQSHQVGNIAEQFENAALTCERIADLIEKGWDIVLTHGNGPQVGNVVLRVELAAEKVYPLPLDICDADTEGGMGYMLQQVLGNTLRRRGVDHTVVTIVTQVRVAADDPAFDNPTKPIGPFFAKEIADKRIAENDWTMVEDSGRGWRRVVPSPLPEAIIELEAIRRCTGNGMIPIAVGGGGVPVYDEDDQLYGIEAVIDKDRASSLLANLLGAELLLITTGVDNIMVGFNTPEQKALDNASRDELRGYLAAGEFPPGSMGPKVEAALAFLENGGKEVIITSPEKLGEAVAGNAGTHIS